MQFLSKIPEKKLRGKTVVLRLDLNVKENEIASSPRIDAAVDTLQWLIQRGARVVVLSHWGQPDSKQIHKAEYRKQYSLVSVACAVMKRVGDEYLCIVAPTIEQASMMVPSLHNGQVIMVENTRLFKGEEANATTLAKQYATLGDIYVNDAFSASHRKEASLVAITRYLPSYAGIQLEKELQGLASAIQKPKKPLVLVLGGAKISDKMGLLNAFANKADAILVGGALATTLLAARDIPVGESLYERDALTMARRCLKMNNLHMPIDLVMDKRSIMDIGERTAQEFSTIIHNAKTIIWNGPLGYIEDKRFRKGTLAIAKAIAESKAYSVVGGGETVAFLREHELAKEMVFVSNGGGAMLTFVSGEEMPAIKALR